MTNNQSKTSQTEDRQECSAQSRIDLLLDILKLPPELAQMVQEGPDIPRRIGDYAIIRPLGEGGFGRVFLAWDERLSRAIAIKVARPGRMNLIDDAQKAAKLNHPGIVTIHTVEEGEDGSFFVVMEFISGGSLADQIQEGNIPAVTVTQWLSEVARAVHHAHNEGIVHRDLKPDNILIDDKGHPKVVDFGLAVHQSEQEGLDGQVSGTLRYMAPEQVEGDVTQVDGRTDVWSLGVILYEMLTGVLPFDGSSREAICHQILNKQPRPPRQLATDVPPALEAICLRCLSKEIADRYSTAHDLAKELDQVFSAPLQMSKPKSSEPIAPTDRSWQMWVAVTLVLALMCGMLGYRYMISQPRNVVNVDESARESGSEPGNQEPEVQPETGDGQENVGKRVESSPETTDALSEVKPGEGDESQLMRQQPEREPTLPVPPKPPHPQTLDEMWSAWHELSEDEQTAFGDKASITPQWWLEQALAGLDEIDDPVLKAVLMAEIAAAQRASGQRAEAVDTVGQVMDAAGGISNSYWAYRGLRLAVDEFARMKEPELTADAMRLADKMYLLFLQSDKDAEWATIVFIRAEFAAIASRLNDDATANHFVDGIQEVEFRRRIRNAPPVDAAETRVADIIRASEEGDLHEAADRSAELHRMSKDIQLFTDLEVRAPAVADAMVSKCAATQENDELYQMHSRLARPALVRTVDKTRWMVWQQWGWRSLWQAQSIRGQAEEALREAQAHKVDSVRLVGVPAILRVIIDQGNTEMAQRELSRVSDKYARFQLTNQLARTMASAQDADFTKIAVWIKTLPANDRPAAFAGVAEVLYSQREIDVTDE